MDSPIGRKNFRSAKTFEVEDQEAIDQEIEKEIEQQRRLKSSGKEPISAHAKKRIEYLLNMTVLTEEVKLGQAKFTLRTLKQGEIKQVLKIIASVRETYEVDIEMKRQLLARSVIKVNDSDIEMFLDGDDMESRLEFVDSLESSLFLALFMEYEKLQKKSEEYYGISTPEKAAEVAEEIKK